MAQSIISGTTTANTVATATFTHWVDSIEIVNSGANDMWARVDGTDPTVSGDECHYIPTKTWAVISNRLPQSGATTTIKMISTVATTYTISGGV